MDSGAFLDEEIGGTTACSGYDQTPVTGTVTLTNPTLNVSLYGGFVPTVGQAYTIINNDSNDAVVGTFNGLAEGAAFTVTGVTYRISYVGGDGNDVVLTVTAVNSAALPTSPNTGFGMFGANAGMILAVTTAASVTILALSRRFSTK